MRSTPNQTGSILSLLEEINREYGLPVIIITHEMDAVQKDVVSNDIL